MLDLPAITLVIIFLALIFDFSNGFHDTANAIATVISTRVLSPIVALGMATVLNFFGAFMNTHVARTIGTDIVSTTAVTNTVLVVALSVASVWNIILTLRGMPASSSHALIGALIGAVMGAPGHFVLHASGIIKILLSLLLSPVMALVVSIILMKIIYFLFKKQTATHVNKTFGKLQIVSAAFMAFSHGSNDAQKSMGIITLALVATGHLTSFSVPNWVIIICATAMAFGTAAAGWRVIHTLGMGLIKLKPVHGFGAESAASLVILGASHFGLPVSTTHVITSAVVGVGSATRISAVRWTLASKILLAWVVTFPICIGAAAIISWLVSGPH
ncbi:MAG: inorganic phosphate transporter [bacterium]|nr:inorganic phosphate transporter [bacterium]